MFHYTAPWGAASSRSPPPPHRPPPPISIAPGACEAGRLRVARDIGALESALERTLGAAMGADAKAPRGASDELRAFRQVLLFADDKAAAAGAGGAAAALVDAALAESELTDALRPSTVMHHALALFAPPGLSLPHEIATTTSVAAESVGAAEAGEAHHDYVETLLGPLALRPALAAADDPFDGPDALAERERTAWRHVRECLDSYAQRVAARGGGELCEVTRRRARDVRVGVLAVARRVRPSSFRGASSPPPSRVWQLGATETHLLPL